MKRKLLLINLIVILCAVTYYYASLRSFNYSYETCNNFLPQSRVQYANYRVGSESNVIECDLATVADILSNMQQDGFILEKSEVNEEAIDLILSKDDIKIRCMYIENKLKCIASIYEKSYLPITYILVESRVKEVN